MDDMQKATELLTQFAPAVLLSADGVGLIYAGPARAHAPQGAAGPYWFLADATRVARWSEPHAISLTFHAPGRPFYVALQGHAAPVADATARLAAWDARFAPWFPEGPADPRLALLEVQVTAADCVEWHGLLAG